MKFPDRFRTPLRRLFWKLPIRILPLATEIRYQIRYAKKINLKRHEGLIVLTEFANAKSLNQIYFYHPQRITRYSIGIQERIDKLLNEYLVNEIPDLRNGVFLDIGSNIGEFSRGIASMFPNAKFIRFEPSKKECLASKLNMNGFDDRLYNALLWNKSEIVSFYERNQTGDSSIFAPDDGSDSIAMRTQTLDEIMDDLSLECIELIKLEAEGAEPEILEGGKETLKKCRYLAADLGPERGLTKEETFVDSRKILEGYGFSLVSQSSEGRKCYLFRNNALTESKNHLLSTD